jgi:hypothetical protein
VSSATLAGNDLRAREGRDTNALNCKPNTTLKEISELSNFSKTSGFILHAVIGCGSRHGSQNISNIISSQLRAYANCVA